MKGKFYIVGVGPGNINLVTKEAYDRIVSSQTLIGGARNLETFSFLGKKQIVIKNNLEEIRAYLLRYAAQERISVLATGDPLVYGIGNSLFPHCPEELEYEVISGISSIQYLAAKCGVRWDDLAMASVHGRNQNLVEKLKKYGKIGIFTSAEDGAKAMRELNEAGFGQAFAAAGEDLSYPQEAITIGTVESLSLRTFSSLTVFIVAAEPKLALWPYTTGGIPDDRFIRGNVPMTKEEIRALSLAKLRLRPDSVLLDMGAGTGSITVEGAQKVPFGRVYAFEKNSVAIELMQRNIRKFGVGNVEIIQGLLEDTYLKGNYPCDRAFIGGAGDCLPQLLQKLSQNSHIRVVINGITIETCYEAMRYLKEFGYENIECIAAGISRSVKAGEKHMMRSLNTVYIMSGERGAE